MRRSGRAANGSANRSRKRERRGAGPRGQPPPFAGKALLLSLLLGLGLGTGGLLGSPGGGELAALLLACLLGGDALALGLGGASASLGGSCLLLGLLGGLDFLARASITEGGDTAEEQARGGGKGALAGIFISAR